MKELPTIPFERYELCLQLIADMDNGLTVNDQYIRDSATLLIQVYENDQLFLSTLPTLGV